MTAMSRLESVFCRSVPWSAFARRVVLPWAVQGSSVTGDVLEVWLTWEGEEPGAFLGSVPAQAQLLPGESLTLVSGINYNAAGAMTAFTRDDGSGTAVNNAYTFNVTVRPTPFLKA